jgi:hypothetical protein
MYAMFSNLHPRVMAGPRVTSRQLLVEALSTIRIKHVGNLLTQNAVEVLRKEPRTTALIFRCQPPSVAGLAE